MFTSPFRGARSRAGRRPDVATRRRPSIEPGESRSRKGADSTPASQRDMRTPDTREKDLLRGHRIAPRRGTRPHGVCFRADAVTTNATVAMRAEYPPQKGWNGPPGGVRPR
ncbi:hypothetical protein Ate01nite_60840 [Actinoplanes teichomyceticus]|nr:hypothetical protein Ate01nite_60840 [Actinoplanes teichomyceticus]